MLYIKRFIKRNAELFSIVSGVVSCLKTWHSTGNNPVISYR